jgi:hypothetical protein
MPTIDNKRVVQVLITNDGFYPDKNYLDRDPQAVVVYEYTNNQGKISWFIAYNQRQVEICLSSSHINNPKVIWSKSKSL